MAGRWEQGSVQDEGARWGVAWEGDVGGGAAGEEVGEDGEGGGREQGEKEEEDEEDGGHWGGSGVRTVRVEPMVLEGGRRGVEGNLVQHSILACSRVLTVAFYRIHSVKWHLGETHFWRWHNVNFLVQFTIELQPNNFTKMARYLLHASKNHFPYIFLLYCLDHLF